MQHRKHIILDKPILGALSLTIWGMLIYQIFPAFVPGTEDNQILDYLVTILFSLVALGIHRLWFFDEYKGNAFQNLFQQKDVRNLFFLLLAIDGIIQIMSYFIFGFSFTPTAFPLALMAGICEEVVFRVLPVSIMMRNWMDEKHILFIALFTSCTFGGIHLTNIMAGAQFAVSMLQILIAFSTGIFFVGLYLRTANIVLCAFFHVFHDLLAFFASGQTNTEGLVITEAIHPFDFVATIVLASLLCTAGFYLIRKSVRPQIVETWKERWTK